MQPLSIGILAALTPPDWQVTFFDDRIETIDYSITPDLVAISVETYTARRAYQIADRFRMRGIPVVLGGIHASLCSDEAQVHADAVCVGEAENVWEQILSDSLRGELKKIYKAIPRSAENWVSPRRDVFTGKKYLPITLVETGRGCTFACDFCAITAFHRQTYRRRPVGEIVAEAKATKGKLLFLVDDNIGADRDSLRELCRALAPLNKPWVSQAGIDIAKDDEIPRLLADSGCSGLLIGFESLDRNQLSLMSKPVRNPEQYSESLKRLRSAGIPVYGTFVFGYPGDTLESFHAAQQFARKERLFLAAFNHLVPFPGTPLYQRAAISSELNEEVWWLSRDFRFGTTPMQLGELAPGTIENESFRQRNCFYQIGSILKRALDWDANCRTIKRALMFLSINFMLRREVRARQGIPLGCDD